MRNWKLASVGVLALAGTLAGCDDYLEGEGLTTDPNQPSSASIDQVFTSVQVRQFSWHNGDLARTASMWIQQMAGTDRQYIDRDGYTLTEDDFSTAFSTLYTGGGLVDIRRMQDLAKERNDRVYLGIAKVLEGYLIGMAASIWGDIPYSEAVGTVSTPKLDDQAAVYAAVQKVLDEAIQDLRSGQGAGPGAQDLVYRGDAAKWAQAANTLKARFYMHWVEAQNFAGQHNGQNTGQLANTACGGNCVQNALAAAQQGIASSANNFKSFHTSVRYEENLWYQFTVVERPGYISAGRNLVELLRTRNDPRLTQYFTPTASGQVLGASPASSVVASMLSAARRAPAFNQPMITYEENQLLLAEANARLGNAAAARTALNAALAVNSLPAVSATLAGADLLREIATEKYIALFQNLEAWNDYKRTCTPALRPASGSEVPGRYLYGSGERNANTKNIPAPAQQPRRNDNDPQACPSA